MNLFRIGSIFLIPVLFSGAYATKRDEEQIRRLYANLAEGLRTKNLHLIDSTQTSDFEESEHGRILSKEEIDKEMQGEFAVTKQVKKCQITVTSLVVSGNTAVGHTKFEMEILTNPESPKDPKSSHLMGVRGTTVEHLVKTKKGWLFKTTSDLTNQSTIDGKPVGR